MEARIRATDEIVEVTKREDRVGFIVYIVYVTNDGETFQDTDLDFLPSKESTTLEGWIVRVGNLFGDDDFLRLFLGSEPLRVADDDLKTWDGEESLRLPDVISPP